MPDKPKSKRKLTITNCTLEYEGTGAKGDFKIYALEAVKEDGSPVTETLRSFAELELGKLIEYEIAPYYKDGVLKNYTVSLPRGNQSQQLSDLRREVKEIKARLDKAGL